MQHRFFKTPDGVKIQELALGRGDQAAKPGDLVVLDYVLRCVEIPCSVFL